MSYTIDDIFRNTKTIFELTLFTSQEIQNIENNIFEKGGKPRIKCYGSDKDRPAKPEEIVRQLWLYKIINEYHYPKERILVEKSVWFGSGVSDKAADIVITHKDSESPYIIFEVKKPKRKDGIKQLKSYCNAEGAPIGVWSNGGGKVILHREEPNIFLSIDEIPTADQSLQDVIGQPWTIDKLKEENRLAQEKLSLKSIILDLENLVLANAKGIDDSFDEIFKLIYAKLYDEWAAVNISQRRKKIQFRIYGESSQELYDKINNLFRDASNKWRGVFARNERIKLSPNHLKVCVSFLQGIRLFNANLQIIDEAFEYLVTEIAKGKKGQYFTPRWVIDMCIKMMNPKIYENVVDPACGSAGFTVHSIFWVAEQQFSGEALPPHIIEYANNNVYGIDSSPRAVKISKAINLIAGDGKTNIYELNTLEHDKWDETGKAGFKHLLKEFDDPQENDRNINNYKYMEFDLVLTNPPFSGNINEKDILKHYRLAEKNGKTLKNQGRDILFIERCLDMLKSGYSTIDDPEYVPGGRCAIILPQGRLNNSSDMHIRNYILGKARLLAVVGLHQNTFKPHTGTKTSVLFLQKYTNEEKEAIEQVISKHEDEWETYFKDCIEPLVSKEDIIEHELPELFRSILQNAFESEELMNESSQVQEVIEEDIKDEINNIEEEIASRPKRFKGKADMLRKLERKKKQLASLSLIGRIRWFLSDRDSVEEYKKNWLADKVSEEMDYPIFFAVSEKGGKDNSGEPVYILDENGEPIPDSYDHFIIDQDLQSHFGELPNGIAEAFLEFAKKEKFYFWE